MDQQIEQKIVERGQEFFNSISGEAPSIFNKGWWTGKVMDWSMKNEDFKVQLFRFVDVLPYLNTSESLLRHIREYFASSGSEVPSVLRWGAGKAGLGGALTAKIMGGASVPTSRAWAASSSSARMSRRRWVGWPNCARTASPLPSTCSAKPRSTRRKATPMPPVTMRYWTRWRRSRRNGPPCLGTGLTTGWIGDPCPR